MSEEESGATAAPAAATAAVQPPSQQGRRGAYQAAYDYVTTFYPRFFTNAVQQFPVACNVMVGPVRVSPLYQIVVAINVDTIYSNAWVGVHDEPVIVTIPRTEVTYSTLHLDQYGKVFPGIPKGEPGVYALVGPDWVGDLPDEVMAVYRMPADVTTFIIRSDKFHDGKDMTDEARLFRRRVRMATLTDYKADSQAGATKILPELVFAYPLKLQADILAHYLPFSFLTRLQAGVESPVTQPKTAREQGIAARFNAYFGKRAFRIQLERGTRAAHAAIINNWLNNKVGDSQWINFRDAGAWADTPQGNLNRSSFNEFILFGNNIDAAAYYQTFNDGNGVPLDGSNGRVYTLRFEKDEIPANERFWSLTAYTPHAIELIPNDANKYAVASYTPGLVTASDESITIVMSVSKPDGVPPANWLPVRDGRFNVMLRDYGPLGSVADGTYVPPPVEISE